MFATTELFIEKLKSIDAVYEVKEEESRDVVVFPYADRSHLFFVEGENGQYVTMVTKFTTVPKEKTLDVLLCCNQLNSSYKWLKFYIDSDNDLMVQDDAIVDESTGMDEMFELLVRRLHILDEVTPLIMRTLYV